jgi:propionyl-CoA synthetase
VRAQLEAQKKQQNNLKRAHLTNIAEKKLAMKKEIMAVADKQLGSLARPARVHFVTLLPETRSGKLLRRGLQAICESRNPGDLATVKNPASLDQIRAVLQT